MYINLGSIQRKIEQQKQNTNESELLASRLKMARKAMHLTLDEAAKDICSVSYLSKIENNLIHPNQDVVDELAERYQVDMTKDIKLSLKLDELIYAIFNGQNISYKLSNNECYQQTLVDFGYLVYQGKVSEAASYYANLSEFVKNFSKKELVSYILFAAYVFKSEERNKDAFKLLVETETLVDYDSPLSYLIRYELIMLAFKIGQFMYIEQNYQNLLNEFVAHGYYDKIENMKFEHFKMAAKYYSKPKLINELKSSYDANCDSFKYIKAYANFISGNYQRALMFIQNINIKNYDDEIKLLRLLILDRTYNITMLKNEIKSISTNHKHLQTITNYLTIKHNLKLSDQLKFVRCEIIDKRFIPDNNLLINYWYAEIKRILTHFFYYKELAQFTTRLFEANQN